MIRFLFLLLLFFNFLFSSVVLKSPNSFIVGEVFSFSLEYKGKDEPSFPNIDKIAGFSVQNAGRSNQITIINGQREQIISQKYILYANKDFILPSFKIKTSNKTFKTKEKQIKMQKVQKTKSNDFDLSLSIDKNSLYVGEDAILTLRFKYRRGLNILNMELSQPNFESLWVKPLKKDEPYIKDGFEIHTLKYLVFPQRSGKLQINPVNINIAMPDTMSAYSFFRSPTKIKKFYSNALSLDVKALPQNLKLIGDFKITSSINKNEINFGEAISFKINISGEGNLDDIEDIKLDIDNATIYENKAKKEFSYKDGKYLGTYSKTYLIVADSTFSIKPIKIEYFDKKTKSKKTIQTKLHEIKVIKKEQKDKELVLEKKEEKNTQNVYIKKEDNTKEKLLFFVLGFICSLLLTLILYYFKREKNSKKQNEIPLIKMVKNTKNQNDLLRILAPYIKTNEKLDFYIYKLENAKDEEFKQIKKEIISILKDINE